MEFYPTLQKEVYLPLAARTATTNGADRLNQYHRGVRVLIEATAHAATPSVVFTVQGKNAQTGTYYTLLASAAITGEGLTVLRIYPGLTAAANVVANDVLPVDWRIIATHGDADSLTYSVQVELLP